jgi:hypothetical protein
MASKQSDVSGAVAHLLEAAVVEIPMALAKRTLTGDGERDLHEAGWRAYDAWVRLANEAANRLYANPAFGSIAGRSVDAMLRWQRLTGALSSSFFGSLWPSVGLPTAREVQAIRAELSALRDELREQRDRYEAAASPPARRWQPAYDGADACGILHGIAPLILNQDKKHETNVGI